MMMMMIMMMKIKIAGCNVFGGDPYTRRTLSQGLNVSALSQWINVRLPSTLSERINVSLLSHWMNVAGQRVSGVPATQYSEWSKNTAIVRTASDGLEDR